LEIRGAHQLASRRYAGDGARAPQSARAEACRWPFGLSRKPKDATAFYTALATAIIVGMAITLTPIDPIQALYWSAVINGTVAVPGMTVMMLMTAQPRVIGKFTIAGWLRWLGWVQEFQIGGTRAG
jgi:Mn2+/Fe2+ NRAMP family transporter